MSFALSLDRRRLEWSGDNLMTLFAQKPQPVAVLPAHAPGNPALQPHLPQDRDKGAHADHVASANISHWRGFSTQLHARTICCRWRPRSGRRRPTQMLDFPAERFVGFFENHRLINLGQHRLAHGDRRSRATISTRCWHRSVTACAPIAASPRSARHAGVVVVTRCAWPRGRFDQVVLACHSDQALAMLGDADRCRTAPAVGRSASSPTASILHRDPALMPRRKAVWSAWNYLSRRRETGGTAVTVTYWMNRLQGIDTRQAAVRDAQPGARAAIRRWSSADSSTTIRSLRRRPSPRRTRLRPIQGVSNTWFAGAWTGYGFHEDGLAPASPPPTISCSTHCPRPGRDDLPGGRRVTQPRGTQHDAGMAGRPTAAACSMTARSCMPGCSPGAPLQLFGVFADGRFDRLDEAGRMIAASVRQPGRASILPRGRPSGRRGDGPRCAARSTASWRGGLTEPARARPAALLPARSWLRVQSALGLFLLGRGRRLVGADLRGAQHVRRAPHLCLPGGGRPDGAKPGVRQSRRQAVSCLALSCHGQALPFPHAAAGPGVTLRILETERKGRLSATFSGDARRLTTAALVACFVRIPADDLQDHGRDPLGGAQALAEGRRVLRNVPCGADAGGSTAITARLRKPAESTSLPIWRPEQPRGDVSDGAGQS